MSLQPSPIPPVPEQTAAVARRAFRRPPLAVRLRDEFGALYGDSTSPHSSRPGASRRSPWRLALVTVLQFAEGLSDRQAAEAVRGAIDWKYALAGADRPGFDYSVLERVPRSALSRRRRAAAPGPAAGRARRAGSQGARAAAHRQHARPGRGPRPQPPGTLGETVRAALNALAPAAPDWLRAVAPPEWHARYDRRFESAGAPAGGPARERLTRTLGEDGAALLAAVDAPDAPARVRTLPAVAALRRVLARHARDPAEPESPGDPGGRPADAEAGVGAAAAAAAREGRVGARAPRGRVALRARRPLLQPGQGRVGGLHGAPERDVLARPAAPRDARGHHAGRRLRGDAPRDDPRGAGRQGAAARRAPGRRRVRQRSRHRAQPRAARRARSSARRSSATRGSEERAASRSTPSGSTGTGSASPARRVRRARRGGRTTAAATRTAAIPRPVHQGPLPAAGLRGVRAPRPVRRRAVERPAAHSAPPTSARGDHRGARPLRLGRGPARLRAALGRRGGDVAGVRAFGLRRARYRGLGKTRLQGAATAAALNAVRLDAWLAGRPLAPTRVSRFARLAA